MPDEFIAELTKLIQAGGYDTILPCSDGGLVAISRHYDRLAPLVHLGCPQPHIVRECSTKARLWRPPRRAAFRFR